MESNKRLAGVAIPLFSLRRKGDAGCGDFDSLRVFAPIAREMGISIIQLLPLEDTTFYGDNRDSYPYRPIASTVLNPIYIALDQLPPLKDQHLEQELRQEARHLTRQRTFSYTEVWQFKRRWLWASFTEQVDTSRYYTDILNRYGDFSCPKCTKRRPIWYYWICLRLALDLLPSVDRNEWNFLDAMERIRKIEQDNKELVVCTGNFYVYCYMVARRQMRRAVAALRRHGLALMGDLPVGVDLHAVDTVAYPNLFQLNLSCGAPPDYFTPEGQNWGFPTYRWSAREKTWWWHERFAYIEQFYDYLRVDHVLGFFRMWSIPRDGRSGMLGFFDPSKRYSGGKIKALGLGDTLRSEWIASSDICAATNDVLWIDCGNSSYIPRYDVESSAPFAELSADLQESLRSLCQNYYYKDNEDLWRKTGLQRLSLLKSLANNLCLCAEDLGMVPQCVYPVLEDLGILKLYLERMPKSMGIEFEAAPYFSADSVATTSTHDCAPLRLWWKEDEGRSRRYYDYFLADYKVPWSRVLTPQLAEVIIWRHLESPSVLCILPLQDWLALDPNHCATVSPESERVNDPSNPNHVWSYSMPLTIEELPREWMEQINRMIAQAKRQNNFPTL